MSAWQSRSDLEHEVLQLHRRKRSRRQIARTLHVSRKVVGDIIEARAAGSSVPTVLGAAAPTRAPRPTKLDAYEPRIRELLTAYPTITAQRILEELRVVDYIGGTIRPLWSVRDPLKSRR